MRTGVAPWLARQPGQLQFSQAPLAFDAVHDLQLLRSTGDGAQEPFPPVLRRLIEAAVHQTQQSERSVPEPTVTVVPVARSAELLGQRGGRCRDNAAGRRMGERLERD